MTSAPQKVGPYRIEGVLGAGGMGSVYAAVGPAGERVALKVVRASLTSDEALRRFEREASVRLDHPNVVRVIDSGMDGEAQPFIVLERLEGRTLAARLRESGPLAFGEAIELGLQTCRGLAAAHGAGVVHRDLKPSNLFLCDDGTVKILDFGVAALATADTTLTASGQVVGTLYYLSPEQAERKGVVDSRTDLWSLGALLFEAVAGRPPFREDTAVATVVAVMLGEPPSLTALRADASPALEAVLRKALAKDPRDRWPTAEAFAAALERSRDAPHERAELAPLHVVRAGARAEDATLLATPIVLPARRRPWMLAAAGIAAAIVAALVALPAWTRGEEPTPPARAAHVAAPPPAPAPIAPPASAPIVVAPPAPIAAPPERPAHRERHPVAPPARPRGEPMVHTSWDDEGSTSAPSVEAW